MDNRKRRRSRGGDNRKPQQQNAPVQVKKHMVFDDKWSAIGFILPNAGSDKPFIDFAVSVDEVERRCNIDFFAPLDDDVEAQLESKYDAKFWGLKK